jgi:hypothetical protein
MNRKKESTFQKLTQVAEFATVNVGLFPKTSAAEEVQKALESGVKMLSEHSAAIVSAETAIRAGRNDQRTARSSLKTVLTRATKIAAVFNTEMVQVPSRSTERQLIDCAHAFLADAVTMRKEFAQHGVPLEVVGEAVESLE